MGQAVLRPLSGRDMPVLAILTDVASDRGGFDGFAVCADWKIERLI
jgi:hypothetical protein